MLSRFVRPAAGLYMKSAPVTVRMMGTAAKGGAAPPGGKKPPAPAAKATPKPAAPAPAAKAAKAAPSKKAKLSGGEIEKLMKGRTLPLWDKTRLSGPTAGVTHAIFSAAGKKGALLTVAKDLRIFKTLLATEPKAKEFYENPMEPTANKMKVLQATFKKAHPLSIRFFNLLLDEKLENKFNDVYDNYNELVLNHYQVIPAVVTSATPLNTEQQTQCKSRLVRMVEPWQQLSISFKTDASILGGLQFQVGDKFADLSVQTVIEKTKAGLLANAR